MTSVFWLKAGIFTVGGTLLAAIDLKTLRLPHALTLPLAATGILFSFLPGNGITPLRSVLGFLTGIVLLGFLSWFRNGSMGFGDAVYSGAIGAYVGVFGLGIALFFGSGLAVIVRRKKKEPGAVGPYLAFGGLCSLIFLGLVGPGEGQVLF
ncbi:prepilin peptidase [Leptospirillum ferriphilum]|uniref:prepilin peptidase n=1 Tax=Leptospirillum ferriphilum TaxID=178606 RepID=UPI0006B16D50|nr:A24 family peptidase [Leptospirillum ferriphilum]